MPLPPPVRRPIPLGATLRDWRQPAARRLLGVWLVGCLLFVPSGLMTRLLDWTGIPLSFGGAELFVSVYLPLVFCVACVMWLGIAWAAIPAYLATFVVAMADGMPLGWAVVFGFANPLGLAVLALVYRAVPIRIDLRTPRSIAFYVLVTFGSAIAGSAGAFVWANTNQVVVSDLLPVWQGWWLGGFLQAVVLNGALLALFGPAVERWKTKTGLAGAAPQGLSRNRLLVAFGVIVAALAGYVLLVRLFSLARLDDALADVGPAAPAVRAAVEGLSMVHWVTLVLVVAIGVFGYQSVVSWTERLRASRDALATANRALAAEAAVRERAEADLRAANAALAEAVATKDRFFSIIAHDLRSPLAAVLQVAEMIHDEADTMDRGEFRLFLGMLEQSASGLYDLLDNLLTWAQLQTDGIRFEPEPLDAREAVAAAVRPLLEIARGKEIDLTLDVPAATVHADPNMVRTLVMNLVSNALKFTEPGGRVTVSAVPDDRRLVLAVRDTGQGIPPELLTRLFYVDTAFTTAGTANEKGSGLGLVLCREMAERHGSSLRVASEVGVGSTFTFCLPTAPPLVLAEADALADLCAA